MLEEELSALHASEYIKSENLAQLRAQIAEATKLLQRHTDEAACAAAKCGCVGETLGELVAGIVEEHAVLAREVEAWREWFECPIHLVTTHTAANRNAARAATDESGALERARGVTQRIFGEYKEPHDFIPWSQFKTITTWEDGPWQSSFGDGYGEPYNPWREVWGKTDGKRVWSRKNLEQPTP